MHSRLTKEAVAFAKCKRPTEQPICNGADERIQYILDEDIGGIFTSDSTTFEKSKTTLHDWSMRFEYISSLTPKTFRFYTG